MIGAFILGAVAFVAGLALIAAVLLLVGAVAHAEHWRGAGRVIEQTEAEASGREP